MVSVISRSTREQRSSSARPEKSIGSAEMHLDRRAVPALFPAAVHRGCRPARPAHRRTRTQRQPRDAGAEPVQPAVGGPGALGEDAQRLAGGEQLDADVEAEAAAERVSPRSTGTWPERGGTPRPGAPDRPGAVKYSALAK